MRFGDLNAATVGTINRIINNMDVIYLFATAIAVTFALLAKIIFGGDLMLADSDSSMMRQTPGTTVEAESHMFLDAVLLLAIFILAFK